MDKEISDMLSSTHIEKVAISADVQHFRNPKLIKISVIFKKNNTRMDF